MAFSAMAAKAFDERQPRIAHYVVDDGGVGFVLDRSGAVTLLKFDGEEEIFALFSRPAGNGDRVLLRDDGEIMVRLSALGGVTLFLPQFPNGLPSSSDRPAMPLQGPPPPIETVEEAAMEAGAKLRQEFGVAIRFEGDWSAAAHDGGLRAILFDSVRNSKGAFLMLARSGVDRDGVRRHVRKVEFRISDRPSLSRQRSVVIVFSSLNQGIAGRHSSHRLARELRRVIQ